MDLIASLFFKSFHHKLSNVKSVFSKALDKAEDLVAEIDLTIRNVDSSIDDLQARRAEYQETMESAHDFIRKMRNLVD